jgi:hypothetical protein
MSDTERCDVCGTPLRWVEHAAMVPDERLPSGQRCVVACGAEHHRRLVLAYHHRERAEEAWWVEPLGARLRYVHHAALDLAEAIGADLDTVDLALLLWARQVHRLLLACPARRPTPTTGPETPTVGR